MKKSRLAYMASGAAAGLFLTGLGWGFHNFYLVVVGAVLIMAALTYLTIPMPTLL
jgi:hypothetical protein